MAITRVCVGFHMIRERKREGKLKMERREHARECTRFLHTHIHAMWWTPNATVVHVYVCVSGFVSPNVEPPYLLSHGEIE